MADFKLLRFLERYAREKLISGRVIDTLFLAPVTGSDIQASMCTRTCLQSSIHATDGTDGLTEFAHGTGDTSQ